MNLDAVLRRLSHTADLNDGIVKIAGAKLNQIDVTPAIAAYRRMVRDVEFDLCELAPTTYYIARAHGAPFTALPIFLTRRFHHDGLVVRDDSGIETPKDLEGKKVGVRAYSVTTGVWARGILANEFDVDTSKVTWVVDDEEHVRQLKLPANVEHVPEGKSLASMMASAKSRLASRQMPASAARGRPCRAGKPGNAFRPPPTANSGRMAVSWPRNGFAGPAIYPFHGLVVVKDSVLKAHPWIADELFKAFARRRTTG